jgi:hypothetical protein
MTVLHQRWARFVCAIGLALCAGLAWADSENAAIDTQAAERQVLVMLRVPPPHYRPDTSYVGGYDSRFGREARQRIAGELAARYGLTVVDSWPMPSLGVDCFVMQAAEGVKLPVVVEAMAHDDRVESVQAMNMFHVLGHDDPLYPLQPTAKLWHLDELHRVTTGRNVKVAQIDSGVEVDHPDLRGRIAVARNFVDARGDVAEFHGTAVAGIIGARGDDAIGIVGVAPQATLMALRACWQLAPTESGAACSSFTVAKALQFALDRDAKVINLSLGGPSDTLVARLVNAAMARGAVVVAASDAKYPDGGFPASLPGVLAVASEDAHDAAAATLLAPGRDLPTTLPGDRWGLVSGSSFAAAQVTGLVALLFDLAPDQKPREIRENLTLSGVLVSSPRRNVIVDACAAVARTAGACACGCSLARSGPSTTER